MSQLQISNQIFNYLYNKRVANLVYFITERFSNYIINLGCKYYITFLFVMKKGYINIFIPHSKGKIICKEKIKDNVVN
jgi:hypothetical protein